MKRFGYYHIEKTGGSWIRAAFERAGWSVSVDGQHYCDGHVGELHIAQNEPLEDVDYSFTLLRYPPSRLLSYYDYSISSGIVEGEGWVSHPSLELFLETLDWDVDYGDIKRHKEYPQHFGSATMPYRSMCYTLELLGVEDGCVYYSFDDPDFYTFLDNIGVDPDMDRVNTSEEISKVNNTPYKSNYTVEELDSIMRHPTIMLDLELWRGLKNNG